MFYHIAGELVLLENTSAVIDCQGVGYCLTVSALTMHELSSQLHSRVKLYTHLQVREDGVELFGFCSLQELQVFRLLIGVSGVGPKAAMAILSVLSPDRLLQAVAAEDTKAISQAPGVGAKTAARVVLELRDKATEGLFSGGEALGSSAAPAQTAKADGKRNEAVGALLALGYNRTEIMEALRNVDTSSLPLEAIVTEALKKFLK